MNVGAVYLCRQVGTGFNGDVRMPEVIRVLGPVPGLEWTAIRDPRGGDPQMLVGLWAPDRAHERLEELGFAPLTGRWTWGGARREFEGPSGSHLRTAARAAGGRERLRARDCLAEIARAMLRRQRPGARLPERWDNWFQGGGL